MIQFPQDFVTTKVPGYFWCVKEQHVYSIKSGVLKFMVKPRKLWTRKGLFEGWVVSHEGKKVYLNMEYLESLNKNTIHTEELRVIRPCDVVKDKKDGKRVNRANGRRSSQSSTYLPNH